MMASENMELGIGGAALDQLMPMALTILPTGHIGRVGPTLAKLWPSGDLTGLRFLEVFTVRRPRRSFVDFDDLTQITGKKLRLGFRTGFTQPFKGIMVNTRDGNLLLNLSFGYSLPDAVQAFALTNGDFSQTDLAIEMLYLLEAKTALMDESRRLNLRLHGARLAAEEQAATDALTGLKNRRAMDQVLKRLTENGRPFGLMHVDLDYFKAVNDTMGHAAGDYVLKVASQVLCDATRKGDTVARVGGDEFVLVFEDQVDPDRLMEIANRIVEQLEDPVDFEGAICRISGSIGFTMSTLYDQPDLDQMLSDADVALYASKHRGRACSTMVTPELLKQEISSQIPFDADPVIADRAEN